MTLLHSFYIHKYVDFNFSAIDNIVKPTLWIAIGLIMGKLVSYIFSFADCKGLVFCIFSAGISGVIIVMVFGYFVWRESVNLKQCDENEDIKGGYYSPCRWFGEVV